jgi:trimeric autotransporter adhesin
MKTTKIFTLALATALFATTIQSCKKSNHKKIDGDWNVTSLSYTGSEEDTYTNTSGNTNKQTQEYSYSFNGSEWDYTMEMTDKDYNGDTNKQKREASNSTGKVKTTYTYIPNSGSTVVNSEEGEYSSEGTISYSFVKDGTFSYSETKSTTTVDTDEYEYSFFGVTVTTTTVTTRVEESSLDRTGEWSFLGKNKAADIKTNERIALTYLKASESVKTTTTTVTTTVSTNSVGSTTDVNTTTNVNESDNEYTYTTVGADEIWRITESKKKSLMAEISVSSTSDNTYKNSYTNNAGTTTSNTSSSTGSKTMTGNIELLPL